MGNVLRCKKYYTLSVLEILEKIKTTYPALLKDPGSKNVNLSESKLEELLMVYGQFTREKASIDDMKKLWCILCSLDDEDESEDVGSSMGEEKREAESTSIAKPSSLLPPTSLFWMKYHHLHPNSFRVKNWLWVHSKYRDYCQVLIDLVLSMNKDVVKYLETNDDTEKKSKMIKKIKKSCTSLQRKFLKLNRKMDHHGQWEETQLFYYFIHQKTGLKEKMKQNNYSVSEDFEALKDNHLNKDHGKDIEKLIIKFMDVCCINQVGNNDLKTLSEKLVEKLQTYQYDLILHLYLEEKVVLIQWLNLSLNEYKNYRRYLSWNYASVH